MLLAKFTKTLQNNYTIRESDAENRVDDFDIIKVKLYEDTEFGRQGSFLCWYGPWDKEQALQFDDDLAWTTDFIWEFQNFLEFYTAPTKNSNIEKFILYTPSDDWTGGHIVIDEIEFERNLHYELDIEDFLVQLLSEKYTMMKVSEESLKKHLE